MRIIGHGVDIVEVARIERLLEENADRFLARVFTPAEIAYADASPRRRTERLAVRFAAKEAAFKAVGSGWAGGISWSEAEVVNEPTGRPTLRAHGMLARVAADLGVARWWVSLSHVETHAIASVIAEGDG